MKPNKLTISLAVVGIFTLGSVASASVVVDNTSGAPGLSSPNDYAMQSFTTAGNSGDISQLSLQIASTVTGTVDVYLFDASQNQIPTANGFDDLGVVNLATGNNLLSVVLNPTFVAAHPLSASTVYAIVLGQSTGVTWQYTAPGDLNFAGAFDASSLNGSYTATAGEERIMSLSVTPVPEPITQAMMILGSVILVVSVGRWGLVRLKTAKGAACTVNA